MRQWTQLITFMKNILITVILSYCVIACGHESDLDDNEIDGTSPVSSRAEKTSVKTLTLVKSDFAKEIISNGKLSAVKKVDLRFLTTEKITNVYVKNGDYVKLGQIVAKLDNFLLLNALKKSQARFSQVKFELQDILIGQGYSFSEESKSIIPEEVMRVAKIKSGYDDALNNMELAQYNLDNTELKAPISGIIANLDVRENNTGNPTEKFCTVIDNSLFEAEFSVIEMELASVRVGQSVKIIPYSMENALTEGTIVKINPLVNEDGLIKVSALCHNPKSLLYEGMNIKAVIQEKIKQQLLIPKQAVVLRNERKVVFIAQNGRAKWKYVKTGLENSSSFVVTEGLNEGDSVIVDGNFNLVHNASVDATGYNP